MPLFDVYGSVKKAIQDIISPEIQGLNGQIQAVHSEIRRLDEKFTSEIRRLDEKIDSKHNELISEIRRLDEKIDMLDRKLDLSIQIHDRLARVEAKLGLT